MQFIFDTGKQRMDPGWFRRSEENTIIRDSTASPPDDISGGNRNLHLTCLYANTAFNEVNLFFHMARHNQYPLLCRCLTGAGMTTEAIVSRQKSIPMYTAGASFIKMD